MDINKRDINIVTTERRLVFINNTTSLIYSRTKWKVNTDNCLSHSRSAVTSPLSPIMITLFFIINAVFSMCTTPGGSKSYKCISVTRTNTFLRWQKKTKNNRKPLLFHWQQIHSRIPSNMTHALGISRIMTSLSHVSVRLKAWHNHNIPEQKILNHEKSYR